MNRRRVRSCDGAAGAVDSEHTVINPSSFVICRRATHLPWDDDDDAGGFVSPLSGMPAGALPLPPAGCVSSAGTCLAAASCGDEAEGGAGEATALLGSCCAAAERSVGEPAGSGCSTDEGTEAEEEDEEEARTVAAASCVGAAEAAGSGEGEGDAGGVTLLPAVVGDVLLLPPPVLLLLLLLPPAAAVAAAAAPALGAS